MELTQCQYSQICQKYEYPIGKSGNTITVASKKPKIFVACLVLDSENLM